MATYTKPEPLSAIGMYVVKKEFQGKGIGSKLFDEAIKICAPRKFLYGGDLILEKMYENNAF